MILDSVLPGKRMTFLAIPHPASRRTFAYLQTVLAACPERIMCALATSFEEATSAEGILVYLRPGAAHVLNLTYAVDMHRPADVGATYSLVWQLDQQWHHSSTFPLEELLARPDHFLRMLSRLLETSFPERVFAAADGHIGALRDDVARYGHPLAFLAALEPRMFEAGVGDVPGDGDLPPGGSVGSPISSPTPRLLIADDDGSPVESPTAEQSDRFTTRMTLGADLPERLRALQEPQNLVHLHHLHGKFSELPLLDWILPRLAAGGRLSGRERSEAAAEKVMAQLTQSNGLRGMVFSLAGCDWHAASYVGRA